MAELFTLKVWVLSRDHNDIIIYHKFRVFVVVWALQLCEKGCVCHHLDIRRQRLCNTCIFVCVRVWALCEVRKNDTCQYFLYSSLVTFSCVWTFPFIMYVIYKTPLLYFKISNCDSHIHIKHVCWEWHGSWTCRENVWDYIYSYTLVISFHLRNSGLVSLPL